MADNPKAKQLERGYIKLWRAIWDNPHWNHKPFSPARAWIDMIMLANYKGGTYHKRGNRIDLLRGQLAWSVKGLADRWGWSQGKVSRYLDELKMDNQIEYQKSNLTTLITIVNYDIYQGDGEQNDTQTVTKRGTDGDQTGTKRRHLNKDKKVNKEKNEKKEYISPRLGEFKNVRLTKEDMDTLIKGTKAYPPMTEERRAELIERLSAWIAQKGDKYKDHYATLQNWNKRDGNGPSKGITAEQENKRADLKRELRIAEDSLERASEADQFTPSEQTKKRLDHWTREVNRIRKQLEG